MLNTANVRPFPYRELKYYSFGLRAGFANLFRNGLALGLKRTIGKITQPINSYSRFPEYHYFDQAIAKYLAGLASPSGVTILDVGSPKLLGLQLASAADVNLTLTDITELNIDQYRTLWDAIKSQARGQVQFELQDARRLTLPAERFDVVYSMSVIEHVQGNQGDSEAMREMIRVLKPGGLLLISVPFGPVFQEQSIIGFADAARPTHDTREYFFQRIYDCQAFERRILAEAALESVEMITVWRQRVPLLRAYSRLGQNIHGALGFLNPFLSAIGNRSCTGVNSSVVGCYGRLHSLQDIYGDLILAGIKRQ
ncbi:MAG TPA: class I SAM-dependent methyltransferase [Terriglobales bacterium]|nr:class I SAM-dependent methyltransferase [Terriglobales bacterium]